MQGLPRAASTCWWLVGRNSWFQLELFQFERPLAKLMPPDFRPCDIGYTRIGIWVEDFDATIEKLDRLGSHPLTPPQGDAGARRVCVRNPDGVYVEIMEADPLPQFNRRGRLDCPAAIRSVTLSVPELADAAAYFETGLGLRASDVALHTPEHEALWGLPGATTRSGLFDGGDVLIEVVQYLDPVGKPWPNDYRVSDQGILNIAFGVRHKPDFDAIYRRLEAFGAKPNYRPIHLPGAGVVYVNDRHGFSVEVMRMKAGLADRMLGFEPRPLHKRPDPDTRRIQHRVKIAASPGAVWDVITDQDAMAQWIGFHPGHSAPRRLDAAPRRRLRTSDAGSARSGPSRGTSHRGEPAERACATASSRAHHWPAHQGEITLQQSGEHTELHWTIRFRPKLAGTGALLQRPVAATVAFHAGATPQTPHPDQACGFRRFRSAVAPALCHHSRYTNPYTVRNSQ